MVGRRNSTGINDLVFCSTIIETSNAREPEQIVRKLREAGVELAKRTGASQSPRSLGVTENTRHHWRNRFAGNKSEEMK